MLGARDHLSAGAGQLYYYYEQKTQVQKAVAKARKITIRWARGPPTPAAQNRDFARKCPSDHGRLLQGEAVHVALARWPSRPPKVSSPAQAAAATLPTTTGSFRAAHTAAACASQGWATARSAPTLVTTQSPPVGASEGAHGHPLAPARAALLALGCSQLGASRSVAWACACDSLQAA